MIKLVLTVLLLIPSMAFCGVIPEKSRIVFNGKNSIQSYTLVNANQYPVVAQLWIDDGDFNSHPELTAAPFVITPVMLKMDPSKINEIKIINSTEDFNLPKDRESLYWLNILEIPPANSKNKSENEVTLSMLTQIKVIYRPEAIEINDVNLIKKLDSLDIYLNNNGGGESELIVNNPTEYVASLSGVTLSGRLNNINSTFSPEEIRNLTVLPKQSAKYPVNLKDARIDNIEYWVIDDQGKFYNKKRNISMRH